MPTTKKKTTKKSAAKQTVKEVAAKARLTIHTPGANPDNNALPAGSVELSKAGLVINIQKLSKALVRDQRARLVSSMGCISNPTGPSC